MRKYLQAFVCSAFVLIAGQSQAQNMKAEHDAADDCTDSSVSFEETLGLTRQEKIDLMDKALLNSLNKYERCQNRQLNTAATGGVAGEDSGGAEASSASAEMSGTSKAVENDSQDQVRNSDVDGPDQNKSDKAKKVLGSGKIPEDIPPADNDSVLEEQIRQAAINETDPVIKAKLWNEYRKYKGLPVVGTR